MFSSLSSKVRWTRLPIQSAGLLAIALLTQGVWSHGAMAQASDALYLKQTVQGVDLQNADSAALLRGDGNGVRAEGVEVNCQNYTGSDFIDLDCLNENVEGAGRDVRWQRNQEDLLIPKGNRSESLENAPGDAGELKIFL